MKKIYLFLLIIPLVFLGYTIFTQAANLAENLKGRILLQVEENGEAWYISPENLKRYFLGRPNDAFAVMREQGIGTTNSDLAKIPVSLDYLSGPDTSGDGLPDDFKIALGLDVNSTDSDGDGYCDFTELLHGYDPLGPGRLNHNLNFAKSQAGRILLQVEQNGEAWYVSPENNKRYFLGRPADAFNVMRNLGLGITNSDLETINSAIVQIDDFLCGKDFIDPRDSQIYPTVKIGTQCWMAKNLNFGKIIPNTSEQTDNLVVEKYCKDVSSCEIFGGLYQWAEAVQYANGVTNKTGTLTGDEFIQGVCPPNWHIPSDNEIKALEMAIGMSKIDSDKEGWRGTNEGDKLKSCSQVDSPISSECNTNEQPRWDASKLAHGTNDFGFSAIPTENFNFEGSWLDSGFNSYFWSSSASTWPANRGTTYAWGRHLNANNSSINRAYFRRDFSFPVRCVKD